MGNPRYKDLSIDELSDLMHEFHDHYEHIRSREADEVPKVKKLFSDYIMKQCADEIALIETEMRSRDNSGLS